MHTRHLAFPTVCAAALVTIAPTAAASDATIFGTQIGSAGADAAQRGATVAMYGGRTVWSTHVGSDRYVIRIRQGGRTQTARIKQFRGAPQLDVGPGPDGPALVYPRCPVRATTDRSGCDIFRYDINSKREQRVTTAPARGSDTAAAIWRGTVAYARRVDGQPALSGIFLRKGNRTRLVGRPSATGLVTGLELRGTTVAFTAALDTTECRGAQMPPAGDLPDTTTELWLIRKGAPRRAQWGCTSDLESRFAAPTLTSTQRLGYAYAARGDQPDTTRFRVDTPRGPVKNAVFTRLAPLAPAPIASDGLRITVVDASGGVHIGTGF